jgi:hypothetical protein
MLMLHDIINLEKLSEGKIHLMKYQNKYYEDWKAHQTHFLKDSAAPSFIKDILIYKNKERPHLFFSEAYVATVLGNSIIAGWFNSWDWLSSYNWYNGQYRSRDSFILNLMNQFYNDALRKYLNGKLLKLIQIQNRFYIKPEPPDLWLISLNKNHHFIEVKRGKDKISDNQLLGLLLINTILNHNIHIVWLYDGKESKKPSEGKIANYIQKYNDLKVQLNGFIQNS